MSPRHSKPSLSRSAGSTGNCLKARLRSLLNSKQPWPFLWINWVMSSVPDRLNLYGSLRNCSLAIQSLTPLPGVKERKIKNYSSLRSISFGHWVWWRYCEDGILEPVLCEWSQGRPQLTLSPQLIVNGFREFPCTLVITWGEGLVNFSHETNGKPIFQEVYGISVWEPYS